VGVLVDSAPEIYPVNFVVEDRSIVFRTDPGSKLRGLERSPSVSFEIDEFDTDDCTGWSVLVKGVAAKITEGAQVRRAQALELQPWPIGRKAHWIRIAPAEVTGRRIHKAAAS
jgi:nitroimidazol reductase NimA-like FMN-containing flavoprotein (pyridoxamine 5'-phosphate oxidase superfamily)